MKQLTMILAGIMMATGAFAGPNDTPEALAGKFIAAVNAKSREGQKRIIHPRCFLDLSTLQKQFLDETLARDFRKAIPEKRTVKITRLTNGEVPFAGLMVWPVKPTHQFEIEFSTGENSSTSIIRFIAQEKDQWFIIVPMLNAENLKKYAEKTKSQPPPAN